MDQFVDEPHGKEAAEHDDGGSQPRPVHHAGNNLHHLAWDKGNHDLHYFQQQQNQGTRRSRALHVRNKIRTPFRSEQVAEIQVEQVHRPHHHRQDDDEAYRPDEDGHGDGNPEDPHIALIEFFADSIPLIADGLNLSFSSGHPQPPSCTRS